jgi:hypothetical protein
MAVVKLRKANETGQEGGVLFVNTGQIVAVGAVQTELHMADGRTPWVKDTPEQVVSSAKAPV